MTRLMILTALLLSHVACDVTKNEVGDAPPNFAHIKKLSGMTFGHIVLTDKAVKEIGTNFSAFVYPRNPDHDKDRYHNFIQRIRRVGTYLDPVTKTQFQGYSIYNAYKQACGGLEREEPKIEGDVFGNCEKILELKPIKVQYEYCGLPVPEVGVTPTENDVNEEQCKCVARNGEKLTAAESQLNASLDQLTILALKQNIGKCAYAMVDPPDLKKSDRWLFGDDRKEDFSEDPLGSKGSRLSIVRDDKGNIEVMIDFINFNGINYTTEDHGYGKWAPIRDVKYDMGKHKLTFMIDEMKTYGQPSGRIFEFNLDRTSPMPAAPDFHRFNGDFIIWSKENVGEKGKHIAKGSAKIDGLMREREPHMPTVWSEEGIEIPE